MKPASPLLLLSCIILLTSCLGTSNKARNEQLIQQISGLKTQLDSISKINRSTTDDFAEKVVVNPGDYQLKGYYEQGVEVAKLSKEMREYIEVIKVELVAKVDGVPRVIAEGRVSNPAIILHKNDNNIPSSYFGTLGSDGKNGKAGELKTKLNQFKQQLEIFLMADTVSSLGWTNTPPSLYILTTPDEVGVNWEKKHFFKKTVLECLVELTQWQINISQATQTVLSHIHAKLEYWLEQKSKTPALQLN